MSSKLAKIFVYGTLKRGEPNHNWLKKCSNGYAKFLSEGVTVNKFPLVIGTRYNIPFLLAKEGTGKNVIGEVYEVDEKMLQNLDILEDTPNYYSRDRKCIKTKFGLVECWIYLITKYPESMLNKEFLECYNNSKEHEYCESYLDSSDNNDLFTDE